jgi:hypothetical protein
MLPTDKQVKPTGCMCPFNLLQILSYIVFTFYVYAFYFINIVVWSDSPKLAWSFAVPYTILLIFTAIFTLAAALSDPTDPTVYEHRLKQFNKYWLV